VSYAETQQEILRAHTGGRPRPVAPPATVPPPPARRPQAPSALPPTTAGRVVPTPTVTRPAVVVDGDADADLAAAVAAARRLAFTTEVEQIVAAAGVSMADVRGASMSRRLTEVRRIVATYLRRRGCSLPEIGRVLNRNHKSVLHLLRTTERQEAHSA
jgi:DnaA-like protein